MARGGLLPHRRAGDHRPAVDRSGWPHAGRRPRRRGPVRVVRAVRGDGCLARAAARAVHDRDERAGGRQPDVEHVVPAARGAAFAGDAAVGPAGQPHRGADAGLRGVGGRPVLGAAAVGGESRRGRARRGGLRVFPGARDRGPRPLPSAVRGPAAADHRCRRPPGHRSRARRQDRPLARAAVRRAAVHRGRAPRLHGGREPDPGGGARAEPPQGSAAARPRGAARAGRRGGSVPAPRRVRAVDAVRGPAGRAQQAAGHADRQSQLVRRAVGFAAVSHARQRGRSRCDPAAARRVHGLPGLAADRCAGDRRGWCSGGISGSGPRR